MGSATQACGRFVFACAMTPAEPKTLRAPVERGWSSLPTGVPDMPLTLAQSHAWNLARTLMACIVVFHIDEKLFGVVEAREYDGDPAAIVREYDPFVR